MSVLTKLLSRTWNASRTPKARTSRPGRAQPRCYPRIERLEVRLLLDATFSIIFDEGDTIDQVIGPDPVETPDGGFVKNLNHTEATADAIAGPAELSTRVHDRLLRTGFNSVGGYELFSEMSFDDLVFSPFPDTADTNEIETINVSYNFDVVGSHVFNVIAPATRLEGNLQVNVSVTDSSGITQRLSDSFYDLYDPADPNNPADFDNSFDDTDDFFSPGIGTTINGTFTTDFFEVPLNAPVTFSVLAVVTTLTQRQVVPNLPNPPMDNGIGEGTLTADFNTIVFDAGDIFNLPDGFTVNSESADIVNNEYGPVAGMTVLTHVSSTAEDGTYLVGDLIPITVHFTQPVLVDTSAGIPEITLKTGPSDGVATYASGSGTDTLTFNYIVEEGHFSSDLNYVNSAALQLNGGTIRDADNNDVPLSLDDPATPDSLGANKDLVVAHRSGALYMLEGGDSGQLSRLDLATGLAHSIGPNAFQCGCDTPSGNVGLAPSADLETVYGSQPFATYPVGDGSGIVGTVIHDTSAGALAEGLAFNPDTGEFYAAYVSSFGPEFSRINPVSGHANFRFGLPVGTNFHFTALAYGNGSVYALASAPETRLWIFDFAMARWLTVNDTEREWDDAGLAFDSDRGVLYALGRESDMVHLYEIDPATASITWSGPTGRTIDSSFSLGGLAFVTPGVIHNTPPTANDDEFSIDENSINQTEVGRIHTTDPDVGDTLGYSIITPNTGDAFSVGSDGRIVVETSAALDYETNPTYKLEVMVRDSGGLNDTVTININLNDLIDEAPRIISDTFSVDENAANGHEIDVVTSIDLDAGDSVSYEIVDGNVSSAFTIDAPTGKIRVKNSAALDFESRPTFNLKVQAKDSAGLTGAGTIIITLKDLIDEPPVVSNTSFDVDENSPSKAVVGTVSSTDPDAGDTATYSITEDNSGGAFTINSSTGVISVRKSSPLISGSGLTFTLTVQAKDSAGLTGSGRVDVFVRNVAPEVSVSGPSNGVRGQSHNFTGNFTDPGADELHETRWEVRSSTNALLAIGSDPEFTFTPIEVGTYTVTYTVQDDEGAIGTASQELTVRAVELQIDPADPTKRILAVGGTTKGDAIHLGMGNLAGSVNVLINGKSQGSFVPDALLVFGQAGNDTLVVDNSVSLPARLEGGDGNDLIEGGKGNDHLLGQGGNDTLHGNDGFDVGVGGEGDDFADGTVEQFIGGPGKDGLRYQGTAGNDRILVSWEPGPLVVARVNGERLATEYSEGEVIVVHAGAGNDRVIMRKSAGIRWWADFFGEAGNDVLIGSDRNDLLVGGLGQDALHGRAGDDELLGEHGHDSLIGGSGDDRLNGGRGHDRLYGQKGDDLLLGSRGRDRLRGGLGDDVLLGGNGHDEVAGGPGSDLLIGGRGRDRLRGGDNEDLIIGDGTIYDQNVEAVNAIIEEWTSGKSFDARVTELSTARAAIGSQVEFNDTTVQDDRQIDVTSGGRGRDRFFGLSGAGGSRRQRRDLVIDLRVDEVVLNRPVSLPLKHRKLLGIRLFD